ncbi:uncharacterized protein LOC129593948 [Paramacrobiotus metropolitanus]|uniref:uncharacterized protein LOC129593948 n=1 Tax=Paramacrobiotus metropolitanus TaxID=2943436 RepID=UPI0024456F0D|nr:uncharacterized protein LOC129593948 [Paramacrobiotus metropolitanus]XP_055346447.1 uncharacterized protein LOC129593948 [Paramacrobiotus metropolitanus]XP_055346448.1 uncharacterized protein LOC129593948 [Paramacrobiotus metropolitanus]XP_055346449.1 uncharacterized protein LOC129593948 [Paramacrobiotus metropolitanus]
MPGDRPSRSQKATNVHPEGTHGQEPPMTRKKTEESGNAAPYEMRNTRGRQAGRKPVQDVKKTDKTAETLSTSEQTVSSSSPQATVEQLRTAQMFQNSSGKDLALQEKAQQVMQLTGCSSDDAIIALHDTGNDTEAAVNLLLEGELKSKWETTGGKRKTVSKAKKDQETEKRSSVPFGMARGPDRMQLRSTSNQSGKVSVHTMQKPGLIPQDAHQNSSNGAPLSQSQQPPNRDRPASPVNKSVSESRVKGDGDPSKGRSAEHSWEDTIDDRKEDTRETKMCTRSSAPSGPPQPFGGANPATKQTASTATMSGLTFSAIQTAWTGRGGEHSWEDTDDEWEEDIRETIVFTRSSAPSGPPQPFGGASPAVQQTASTATTSDPTFSAMVQKQTAWTGNNSSFASTPPRPAAEYSERRINAVAAGSPAAAKGSTVRPGNPSHTQSASGLPSSSLLTDGKSDVSQINSQLGSLTLSRSLPPLENSANQFASPSQSRAFSSMNTFANASSDSAVPRNNSACVASCHIVHDDMQLPSGSRGRYWDNTGSVFDGPKGDSSSGSPEKACANSWKYKDDPVDRNKVESLKIENATDWGEIPAFLADLAKLRPTSSGSNLFLFKRNEYKILWRELSEILNKSSNHNHTYFILGPPGAGKTNTTFGFAICTALDGRFRVRWIRLPGKYTGICIDFHIVGARLQIKSLEFEVLDVETAKKLIDEVDTNESCVIVIDGYTQTGFDENVRRRFDWWRTAEETRPKRRLLYVSSFHVFLTKIQHGDYGVLRHCSWELLDLEYAIECDNFFSSVKITLWNDYRNYVDPRCDEQDFTKEKAKDMIRVKFDRVGMSVRNIFFVSLETVEQDLGISLMSLSRGEHVNGLDVVMLSTLSRLIGLQRIGKEAVPCYISAYVENQLKKDVFPDVVQKACNLSLLQDCTVVGIYFEWFVIATIRHGTHTGGPVYANYFDIEHSTTAEILRLECARDVFYFEYGNGNTAFSDAKERRRNCWMIPVSAYHPAFDAAFLDVESNEVQFFQITTAKEKKAFDMDHLFTFVRYVCNAEIFGVEESKGRKNRKSGELVGRGASSVRFIYLVPNRHLLSCPPVASSAEKGSFGWPEKLNNLPTPVYYMLSWH